MRLLATQYEGEQQEKTFDSKIRILHQAKKIRYIFHTRTLDSKTFMKKTLKTQRLPVTEEEMEELEDMLIQQVNNTIQSVTLNLPMKSKETCWNSLLTQDQKEEEIFVGKCGECQATHEYPRCQQCRKPRQKSGPCSGCSFTKQQENPYKGYCGNCFQMHEFPNCVQCQHYRIKPGRCSNCGAVGPDDTQWIHTCLGQDEEYEKLMTPVLEARKKKIAEETQKFITYRDCPLCQGFFHAAKACIFRTHVKHFNILKTRMELFADENTTTKMVILDSDSEESDDSEEEEDCDSDSTDGVDESYMLVTRPTQDSDEDMEEDEDSFSAKFKKMIKYDKILTIVTKQKKEKPKTEEEEEEEEEETDEEEDKQDDYMEVQDEDDQNEDDDSHDENQRNGGNQESQEDDQDQDQAGQAEDQDEDFSSDSSDLEKEEQPEEKDIVVVLLVKKTDEDQENQKPEKQPTNQRNSRQFPDTRKFVVFGDHPDETACELSKESFKTSIL